MRSFFRTVILLFVILVISAGFISADSYKLAPLGFEFGMSDGDAKKQIKNSGYEIIKNEKDSKKVRTILFDGTVVDVTEEKGIEQKTRLEFFNDKLMSSALMIKTNDNLQFIDIQNEILKGIVSKHGEPSATDRIFSYDTWEWDIDHLVLVLSANRDNGKLKLEYTYNPVASKKVDSELQLKRKGEVRNPADQMFKDGNYSQQGGPGARTF